MFDFNKLTDKNVKNEDLIEGAEKCFEMVKDLNFIGSQLKQAAIDKEDERKNRLAVVTERIKEMSNYEK